MGERTEFTYDRASNLLVTRDATGIEVRRTYDSLSRIASETVPELGTSTFTYDATSNLLTQTDPAGNTESHEYDAVRRNIRTTDRAGQQILQSWDLSDKLGSVTDRQGNTTSYEYDLLKRQVKRTDQAGRVNTWTYDAGDNLTALTRPSGRAHVAEYDRRSQLILFGMTAQGTTPLGHLYSGHTFTYDPAGNNTLLVMSGLKVAQTFDALNRMTKQETDAIRATCCYPSTWLTFGYDGLGRKTTVADNFGATTTNTYDDADRITSIVAPSGKTVELAYDRAGRLAQIRHPSTLRTDFTYDTGAASAAKTARLASIAHALSGTGLTGSPVNQRLGTSAYGYDVRGNITSVTEATKSRAFQYDALERLTKVQEPLAAPQSPVDVESYLLDAEGNRVASHRSAFHLTEPANRLVEDQHYVYEINADGLLLRKSDKASGESWRYWYDAFDNLTTAFQYTTPAATTGEIRRLHYRYDPHLRRALARYEQYGGTREGNDWTEERFFHDNDNVYRMEWNAIAGQAVTPRRQWFTQAGPDDLVAMTIADPAQMQATATRDTAGPSQQGYDIHTDDQGSVRAIADTATGQVVAAFDYDSHGNATTAVETLAQPFRWQGRELDRRTGLYHFRARAYDPNTGRFIQEDPLHFDAGDLNLYRFTWSNPRNWRDPSGMSAIEYGCMAGLGLAAGTTVGSYAAGIIAAPLFQIDYRVWGGLDPEARMAALKAQLAAIGLASGATVLCGKAHRAAPAARACPYRPGGANSFAAETAVWRSTRRSRPSRTRSERCPLLEVDRPPRLDNHTADDGRTSMTAFSAK